MYTALAFYLGKLSIELPIQLVLTFIYASILCKHYVLVWLSQSCLHTPQLLLRILMSPYTALHTDYLAALDHETTKFFVFLFALLFLSLHSMATFTFIGAVAPSQRLAQIIAPFVFGAFMATGYMHGCRMTMPAAC